MAENINEHPIFRKLIDVVDKNAEKKDVIENVVDNQIIVEHTINKISLTLQSLTDTYSEMKSTLKELFDTLKEKMNSTYQSINKQKVLEDIDTPDEKQKVVIDEKILNKISRLSVLPTIIKSDILHNIENLFDYLIGNMAVVKLFKFFNTFKMKSINFIKKIGSISYLKPIKYIVGFGYDMIVSSINITKSIMNVGLKSLKFVWDTFKFGLDSLASWTSSIFGWMFKPPMLFFIGIPIILAFAPILFSLIKEFSPKIKDMVVTTSKYFFNETFVGKLISTNISFLYDKFKNSDFVTKAMPEIMNTMYFGLETMIGKENLQTLLQTVNGFVTLIHDNMSIFKVIGSVYDFIGNNIGDIEDLLHGIQAATLTNMLWTAVGLTSIPTLLWKFSKYLFKQGLKWTWQILKFSFTKILSSFWNVIFKPLGSFISRIPSFISKAFSAVGRLFKGIFGRVGQFARFITPALGPIGRVLGRAVPILGWALLAWDIISLSYYGLKALSAWSNFDKTIDSHIASAQLRTQQRQQLAQLDVLDRSRTFGGKDTMRFLIDSGLSETDEYGNLYGKYNQLSSDIYNTSHDLSAQFDLLETSILNDRNSENAERGRIVGLQSLLNVIRAESKQLYLNDESFMYNNTLDSYQINMKLNRLSILYHDLSTEFRNLHEEGFIGINSDWVSSNNPEKIADTMRAYFSFLSNMREYVNSHKIVISKKANHLYSQIYSILKRKGITLSQESTQLLFRSIHDYAVNNKSKEEILQLITSFEEISSNTMLMNYVNKGIDILSSGNITSRGDIERELNAMKFANGGLIIKQNNKTDVLPLNTKGVSYVQDTIKRLDLEINMGNNTEKEQISNITIIEESIYKNVTYELYTMEKLSKGILGL